MECLRKWSHSVEQILILGCGLHEPFTMGRSDGCEGLSAHGSAHSSGTLSCHQHITQTAENHGIFLLMGVPVKKFCGKG